MFEIEGFVARAQCGPGWTQLLIAEHTYSDIVIFMAYYLIPILCVRHYLRFQKGLTPLWPKIGIVLFALFISFCGTTHITNVLMFYYPVYRFDGLIHFLTASVSVLTVFWLALPGAEYLDTKK